MQHDRRRDRRVVLSSGAAVLARAVQVATSLVTVPLTLKYLGTERFGLWMTLNSLIAMAAFADFGVGNGVLNAVSKAFGEDDIPAIRRVVSSGFVMLTALALLVLILFFAAYPFVHWSTLFKVNSTIAAREAGPTTLIFAVCFALNISVDVVQRVQLGMQEAYRYGLWQAFGSLIGLSSVLVGIHFHVGLPVLITCVAGGPLLATMLNSVHFFGVVRPDLRPSFSLASRSMVEKIARLGGLFFVLQIAVSVAFSADSFIIARTLGAAHVPEYAIPQRAFALISMLCVMLMTPLWPAYGEAAARGDTAWIRRTLQRSLLFILLVSTVASVTLLLNFKHVLAFWVGGRIHPPFALLLGLAVWSVLDCCGNALAMYLNGTSVVRFQIAVAATFGLACVTAKVFFIRRYGVVAIPWSTVISYTLLNALPSLLYVPKIMRASERGHGVGSLVEAVSYPLAAMHAGEE